MSHSSSYRQQPPRRSFVDNVRRQWPWFIGFGACVTALLLGLLSLTQSNITWPHRIFLILLGTGGLGFLVFHRLQSPILTPHELEHLGMGQIVAKAPKPKGQLVCSLCAQQVKEEFWQRDKVFCSEKCQQTTQTRMESPRYFVPPPLPADKMIQMLDQSVQLGERAVRAASQQVVDQPLLLAARRGQGPVAKIERVALSLDVWGWSSWAKQLRLSPPPEPRPSGGFLGEQKFFALAEKLKEVLQEHPLPNNPFDLLQLQHALDRNEYESLQQQSLDPTQQEALARLGRLLDIGEQKI